MLPNRVKLALILFFGAKLTGSLVLLLFLLR